MLVAATIQTECESEERERNLKNAKENWCWFRARASARLGPEEMGIVRRCVPSTWTVIRVRATSD